MLTDLLGPSSPNEQLPGVRTPVREWYLVGMLAPRARSSIRTGRRWRPAGRRRGRGAGPGRQPAKVVLFPSSVGFTAAVELTCTSLTVSAAWGRYEEITNPTRRPRVRTSDYGSAIPPADRCPTAGDGDIGPLVPDPAQPEVAVRGRCRRTASCWLVTLFLVNEQMPVRQNIDERWMFQVELAAAAAGGGPVFVGRDVALPDQAGRATRSCTTSTSCIARRWSSPSAMASPSMPTWRQAIPAGRRRYAWRSSRARRWPRSRPPARATPRWMPSSGTCWRGRLRHGAAADLDGPGAAAVLRPWPTPTTAGSTGRRLGSAACR